MAKGVKGSGTKPSKAKEVQKVEQKQDPNLVSMRCKGCRSNRHWTEIGQVNPEEKLFQCGFCKRVLIAKEIPLTSNPMDAI